MKITFILICSLVFLSLIYLTGCASREKTQSQAKSALPKVEIKEQAAKWEIELAELLNSSKKENRVVVYSTVGSEPRIALTNNFQEKYKITPEFIAGRGAEISQRIFTERKANLYLADVYIGGPTTLTNELKPAGVFEPLPPYLFLPEVLKPEAWYGGVLPYLDKEKVALAFAAYTSPSIGINTELVKESEVKSYRDLLLPRWKGKIIMNDPSVAGTGSTWFSMVALKIMNLDYMRELAKQSPVITRDQRQQVEWLARGKFAIAITPKPEEMGEFANAGAPIKNIAPDEGMYLTMGSGNGAIFKQSPHPKAAKLFINWLLSKEGQYTYSKSMNVQSAREDIPVDHLDPIKVRKPGIKYFTHTEESLLTEPKMWPVAREIFEIK